MKAEEFQFLMLKTDLNFDFLQNPVEKKALLTNFTFSQAQTYTPHWPKSQIITTKGFASNMHPLLLLIISVVQILM